MEKLITEKRKMIVDFPKQIAKEFNGFDGNNNKVEEKEIRFPFIEIPSVHIKNGVSENVTNKLAKKYKRKRKNLDQLLSQVEAKRRKEQDLELQTTTTTITDETTAKSNSPVSISCHTLTQKSPTLLSKLKSTSTSSSTSSNSNFSNDNSNQSDDVNQSFSGDFAFKNNPDLQSTDIPTTSQGNQNTGGKKRRQRHAEKANKRSQNATKRYSSLTSSQLQRRLVANARERSRVHALSTAFNSLRCAIPSYSTEQKLSKLTILRVAINYINALEQILIEEPPVERTDTNFARYVNECSNVLHTEYGRSKTKLALD
ncbi:basic helix-loop-helix transcription factor amos-like [Hydractinia symbiolongicarpus]|uniref:basic helix-loop-helix transcription factor amos-like n=1 Tax=Hydractinia symbiolongicarpus TaxID=13093 RepID=UPI00254A552F|nr:basic helix-loop-helix transcription factor amos-like [Hydractinia symbiolongicarpus]